MTDQSRTDRLGLRIADVAIRRPWWVIAAALVLAAAAASGVANLEFANNYRVFFGPDNPELIAFENFQNTYTKNDNILFVLQPDDGEVFSPRMAEAVERLTADAWKIPYAIRVDSVTNFQHSWADGDDLTVEDLIRNGGTLPAAELKAKREVALAEPLLAGNLVSPDAGTTGVNVTLQYPEESLTEVPQAVRFARDLAAGIQTDYPGVHVALSGVSMLNNAFAESGQQDTMTLMPLMFLVLIVFMVVVLRSLWGTLSTLVIIGLSTATAFGIAGHVGIQLTPISVTAAVIILTLAIADSVHVLVTMLSLMREGRDKIDALRESVRINFLAVAITSVTTIIGFLTLNFSDAPPYWDLGNITAVGIAMALVYSLTLLPAVLAVVPIRVRQGVRRRAGLHELLGRFADRVTANYRPILAGAGITAVVLIAFVPTIDLNDEFVKYFDQRVQFRNDAEFQMEHLNGIYLIEFSVEAGEPGGISDPVYLANLEAFTRWLREQPEVMHVYSYSDVIKRLNRNMNADHTAFHRVPDDRELAAQYLLLYELSLPYGLDLNDRINIDKSATRITASAGDLSTGAIRNLLQRSEQWLVDNTPPAMWSQPTGATVMFSYISERNIDSMLRGNLIAVLLISGIMILALRSFALGTLSLVPNALPILMTFGLWAILVRQVGMAAATVSATSLGIVVDDTVHFMTKYLRARREKGLERPQAIRYAFETVGTAIVSTTIILAFGFAVLAASTFRINAQMGLLTAMTIVVALIVDFLLLPTLLMVGHRSNRGRRNLMLNPKFARKAAALGLVLAALIAPWTGILADSAETPNRGFEIAARSDRSDRGFGDSTVNLEMVLRNKAGKESTRELSLATLEIPDESVGDKSLIVFDNPADVEGTALLSHAKILDPDDQWLYLPALKRVKRISSVNKSGPFVGSEFAFEDFTALELNKFDYEYVGEEQCGDLICDVLQRSPRYEHSGYTRQLAWVDQQDFQIRKVEFYDRRGDLLKTLELTDYRQYDDAYWRAHKLSMVNHQTGKSTDLIYTDYVFGTGLTDSDFVRGVLQRVR
jgi:predicted RND superfamily exporter protein/outer membrane lipoprotein-sorting protein